MTPTNEEGLPQSIRGLDPDFTTDLERTKSLRAQSPDGWAEREGSRPLDALRGGESLGPRSMPFDLAIDEHFIGSGRIVRVDRRGLHDPFIRTLIQPRGWRVAWAVLRGRYELLIRVNGTDEAVRHVMKLAQARR